MKFKRSKKSKKGRIEIIPMIDVMFFLLATFMLASLSMQNINSLPVNLAQGKSEAASIEEEITLTINKNGEIFLNKELIKFDKIVEKLSPLISEKNDKVIIVADENSAHGIVTKAITSTIIKTAAQYAANTAIDKETKDNQLLGALMKLGVGVAQAATTKADTRVWANLPNSIQVAVIDRPVSGVLTINSPTGSKLVDVTLPAALDTFVYLKASGSSGVPAAYVKALPTGN